MQNHLLFGEECEEEATSSDDDLKGPSVMEDFCTGGKKSSGIKKGVDPDVGEYQIDLNHPDSFSIAKEMDDHEADEID